MTNTTSDNQQMVLGCSFAQASCRSTELEEHDYRHAGEAHGAGDAGIAPTGMREVSDGRYTF